jgi:hypothetical protein
VKTAPLEERGETKRFTGFSRVVAEHRLVCLRPNVLGPCSRCWGTHPQKTVHAPLAHGEIPAGRNLPRPEANISSINRQFVNAGLVSGPIRASLPSGEGRRVKWRSAPPGSPGARDHARPGGSLGRSWRFTQRRKDSSFRRVGQCPNFGRNAGFQPAQGPPRWRRYGRIRTPPQVGRFPNTLLKMQGERRQAEARESSFPIPKSP